MQEFRLIQVADLHLGAGQEHHLDNWRKVLAWVAREQPALAVVNGDLVMSDPDSETDHAFARAEVDRIGIPCRFLPGNHDIGDNVLFGKMAKRVNAERMARFLRHYGEDRWSFSAAGWGFVGFNAQLFGSGGLAAEAEQWAWIEHSLAALACKPVALFTHKPLFLDHPGEADHEDLSLRQSCLDAASRARLLGLAHAHGVRLISSGHKHQTRTFSLEGIYHFWCPSTACVNGAPSALHWGMREVGFIDYRFRADGSFEHRIVGADFLFRHENYIRKLVNGE
ncbi:MAG: metallophosphoesterase [Burkholderiales bacterium]|nr:metallophosphoesterase [Burkholderiales bacterium]